MLTITPYNEGLVLPPAYAPLIRERNENIALRMAQALGAQTRKEVAELLGEYPLLPQAYDMRKFPYEDPRQFYGALVEHEAHGMKGLLRPPIDPGNVPEHMPRGLDAIHRMGLPGYIAFNEDQAMAAYDALRLEGHEVRLKNPEESDGNGQHKIDSKEDLRRLLSEYTHLFRREIGMVLEANLEDVDTHTVGQVLLPTGERVSLAGKQIDLEDRDGFGGIDFTLSRRAILDVMRDTLPSHVTAALPQVEQVFGAFSEFLRVSRISFDIVSGRSAGQQFCGLADVTLRVGGTCPGTMEALNAMQRTGLSSADAFVRLHWNPASSNIREGFRYIDNERLVIVADAS
ncbi:DUF3182 family protein [Candidatus Peregrinibacteria bacterium]|nr:DUF3182 family protein [Candidatus Peregrinibacteria bacterium]MBT4631689.1 DUF3182 family protein [Candidatus Peregrinibacteria bacterium]MBT5824248.1 DUF3182 family protein [Candidatus Peregrinibacteria bacterium]